MKTAKATPSDLSSSRRAQPVRQTRINPPRSSGSLLRFDSRGASGSGLGNGHNPDQRTEFFPAITHFADAITALPKELVRHFTLLKEVDAKIFAPEESLAQLVDAALTCPLPARRPDVQRITGSVSTLISAVTSINSSNTHGPNDAVTSVPEPIDSHDSATAAWDPENIPRRQLFRQCSYTMQEMLVSLDEKNHVISTATEALSKQMWRLKDVFPHIEREVSEEARFGSTSHWAYTEMRVNKPVERPRRDIGTGSHIANSHHLSVDEAAARSESRKQALLAKKSRAQQTESDFDDHDHRHKVELSKRVHGNSKKARPADSSVGLGISNGTNGNPPSKRRKIEKGTNGGSGMERSLSSVFGGNGTASKTKTNSPRDTPVPEGPKKKSKAAVTTNGHARKRTLTSTALSPSIASSPIQVTLADPKALARASSPAPNNVRPTISRGRQNSTVSAVENARQRPSLSAPNVPNGANVGPADLASVTSITGRSISEVRGTTKESASNSKGEHMVEDANKEDPEIRGGLVVGSKKESTLKREESILNGESTVSTQVINTIVTTKSGRASKPSTPAIPQFPEPIRSRSARNALEQTATNKRSHKKGAGQAAQLIAAQTADDDAASSMQDDDEDMAADEDEPTYCFCNNVSYGEMVGCDSDTCTREWFHLACVGLKVAPKGSAKWYCDDCKENMKGKRFNGR